MLTIDTYVKNGTLVEEVQDVIGLRAHLAALVDDLLVSHPGQTCAEGTCLLLPPTWTWYLGLTGRLSLGHYIWRLGQWAAGYQHPVVRERVIARDDSIVTTGWDPDWLEEALLMSSGADATD